MREEASLWLKQAVRELEAAQINLEQKEYFVCVFYAHQTAEKALKALYIDKNKKMPPKTHNLLHLGEELDIPNQFLTSLKSLTPQYSTSRYPDAAYGIPAELYDYDLASKHKDQAEEILAWVKSQLRTK